MRRVVFFRHAKTEQPLPGQSDFDRALTDVGIEAASKMGREISARQVVPDVVFCSTARRTRQTLELASASWPEKGEVQYREDLYLAEPAIFLKLISCLSAHVSCVMFVAHNPGIAQAALMLAKTPQDPMRESLHRRLREDFPTAALAVLSFQERQWSQAAWGKAELQSCLRVKEL